MTRRACVVPCSGLRSTGLRIGAGSGVWVRAALRIDAESDAPARAAHDAGAA